MIRILLLLLFPVTMFGQNILLTGYVKDGKTNAPIKDAHVRLYMGGGLGELSTYTKSDGYYEITSKGNPIDRNYAFTIQKDGYQRLNGIIRLNFGNEPQRNYKLYESNIKPEEEVVEEEEAPSLIGAPANNLTFLIDVSGSMGDENRLENLKESLVYLIKQYRPEDRISIITYSTYSRVLLDNSTIQDMSKVESIIQKLKAGGQSKGTEGLKKAYDLAMVNYRDGGNNKIILATDGFFGTDRRAQNAIEDLIEKGLKQGVKLSIFSFGKKDKETEARLEKWCNKGSGYYTNITSVTAAKRQIIEEAKGK